MPKIRRFISVTFNVRSAKNLPSGLLQKKKKKIEVIIIVYIAKRSYAENAQTTFSIFAKNVLNRYDYPVPLTLLLFFLVIIKKKTFYLLIIYLNVKPNIVPFRLNLNKSSF